MSLTFRHQGVFAQRLAWPLAIAFVAVVALGASGLMCWQRGPVPSVHDEFGNLLIADTLLHGRLANPPPAIWQPFQSFHILVSPSYASKYPLGPGALLALGICCWGSPAAGIWLGAAFCAAAVTWAAAGCLPRRWAVVTGLLLALHPGVHHAWSLSYMNGWLTATAGALVAGSVLRLRRSTRVLDCILLGVGVGGLALTRPFEGLLFTLTSAALLLYWWRWVAWREQFTRAGRIALQSCLPVVAALSLIAVHNRATTGSSLLMPYQLHEARYAVAPLNIFQKLKEPEMNRWSADVPPAFFDFHYGWSLASYQERASLWGWLAGMAGSLDMVTGLWGCGFCLVATLSLVRRGRAYRPIAGAVALALLVGSFVPWFFAHYFAPSLLWLAIITAAGWRMAITRYTGDRTQLRLCTLALLAVQAALMSAELSAANGRPYSWADQRAEVSELLKNTGEHHLVLVRYEPGHNVHREWVFNDADLEHTPVLWARSWRDDLDEQLVRDYQGRRKIWLLEVDRRDRPHLTPFFTAEEADAAENGQEAGGG